MALGSCRACGHRVSTRARHCPRCGEPKPVTSWMELALGVLVLASLFGAALGYGARLLGRTLGLA